MADPSEPSVVVQPRPGGGGAALQLRGVSKVYPNGTVAVRDVDLELLPGRIHGIAGANGAGKSTLIKLIAGVIEASHGEVRWRGELVSWHSPGAAAAAGVTAMHQHVPLVGTLSVIENVFLSSHDLRRNTGSEQDRYAALCESAGVWIDPDALVEELPLGLAQVVALLQALASDPQLLILDEPTASLGQAEREALFGAIRRVRARGAAILYISHFLEELLTLTDDLTVMRDGAVVRSGPTAEFDAVTLAAAITGPGAVAAAGRRGSRPEPGETVLEVDRLTVPGVLRDLSFSVRQREVVGIAGLLGSGRSELLHAIMGSQRFSGSVRVEGRPLRGSVRGAIDRGLALVPEDRVHQGLLPDWSIAENVCLPLLRETSRAGFVDVERVDARGRAAIELLKIKAPDAETPVSSLSGGNAQKVLFGRWASRQSKVLLLDEPTAGIDIGAKRFISQLIRQWAADGTAVLVADSELKELLGLCDRILVLFDGAIVLDAPASELDEHRLILAVNGITG